MYFLRRERNVAFLCLCKGEINKYWYAHYNILMESIRFREGNEFLV